jgi:tetratricopeptide (TPR) repeat protein
MNKGQKRELDMLRRTYPIALISIAAWMTGCASTNQNANARTAQGGPQNPFVDDAKEMETPAILPQTHFAAGHLFEQQGLVDKAIEQYRKAIAVGHEYIPAYHRLAMLLSKTQCHKEAVEVLTRATIIKPGNAVLHNNLGFEYAFLQDWPKAEREVRRAIKLKPDFARAHVNLGMILSRNGQFDQALASFRKVLPESDAHYNLGLMFRSQQRYEDAAWAFNRAIDHDPQFAAAKTQLEQIAPKLARAGGPDTKHARVQFFRPDPEGVHPKDAATLDAAAANTNVFAQGHSASEAAYGFPRTQNDQTVASGHPSEAAFRFDSTTPSKRGAVARGNRLNRGTDSPGALASRSFNGRHPSEAAFAPPSLPTDRVLSFASGTHPPSQAAFNAPGTTRHAGAGRTGTPHPSEAAFGYSGPRARTTMASTVLHNQRPATMIHRESEAKYATPPGQEANARSFRGSNRTMSATIVPEFQRNQAKIKAQQERLRKIRNRIRELEKEYGDQQNPAGTDNQSDSD